MNKKWASQLCLVAQSATWYTCTLPEKPTMMWTHFGCRFPFVAKIERDKGKHYILIMQVVCHFFCLVNP